MIKDSGERTTFSTGAQRDMHAGKGRFDLLPWEGIHEVAKLCEEGALKYGEHNVDKGIPQHSLLDSAFRHLKKHVMGETDEDHLRAAAWNVLWALQQRKTHPELIDVPWKADATPAAANTQAAHAPGEYGDEGCDMCLYFEVDCNHEPCSLCCRGGGPSSGISYFAKDPLVKQINPAT